MNIRPLLNTRLSKEIPTGHNQPNNLNSLQPESKKVIDYLNDRKPSPFTVKYERASEHFQANDVSIEDEAKKFIECRFQPGRASEKLDEFIKKVKEKEISEEAAQKLYYQYCFYIADNHGLGVLSQNFEKFTLREMNIDQRLEFCKMILKKDGVIVSYRAENIAENLEKFALKDMNIDQRLELCRNIVEKGIMPAYKLLENFKALGKEEDQRRIYWLLWLNHSNELKQCEFPDCKLNDNLCKILTADDAPDQDNFQLLSKVIVQNEKLECLNGFKDKISKMEDSQLKQQKIKWLAYCAALLINLDAENIVTISNTGLLDKIYEYRSPAYSYNLVSEVAQLSLERLKKIEEKKNKWKKWGVLPSALLMRLEKIGFDNSNIEEFINEVNKDQLLKDGKNLKVFIQLIFNLLASKDLQQNEVEKIFQALKSTFKNNVCEQKISQFNVISTLLKIFGKTELIDTLEKGQDAQKRLIDKFQSLFELEESNQTNFSERYQETFGKFRNQTALFNYYQSINELPGGEREKVKSALNAYVNDVLKKTFRENRYDIESSAHLKLVFNKYPNLKKSWIKAEAEEAIQLRGAKGKDYKISETHDPCDLLLIGTEVAGSCLQVNGNLTNKCLASYLMNGELRPIVVKRRGRIVARRMMRLMWDEQKEKPVILLEKLYLNTYNEEISQAIIDKAVAKAKSMNVYLVSKEIRSDKPYPGTIKCAKGFAPFTYSDAASGIKDGPFVIEGSHILYEPQKQNIAKSSV
jgi:hypothetical protein